MFPVVFIGRFSVRNQTSNEHIAFYQMGSALLFALFGKHALAEDAGVSAEAVVLHVSRWRIMLAVRLK